VSTEHRTDFERFYSELSDGASCAIDISCIRMLLSAFLFFPQVCCSQIQSKIGYRARIQIINTNETRDNGAT